MVFTLGPWYHALGMVPCYRLYTMVVRSIPWHTMVYHGIPWLPWKTIGQHSMPGYHRTMGLDSTMLPWYTQRLYLLKMVCHDIL